MALQRYEAQELGFAKPEDGRLRRELAPEECCPEVAEHCALTDAGFDPVSCCSVWADRGRACDSTHLQDGIICQPGLN